MPSNDSYHIDNVILVVDDEENILSSISRLLDEEDGFDVLTANSGEKGLELLASNKIDLIISDMRMPNMNGAVFLSKAADKYPDIIRILLTGFSDIKSTIQAVNEGKIAKYIQKPWDNDELIETLRSALEIKNLKEYNAHLERIREEQNIKLLELTDQQETIIKNRTEELEQTASQLEVAYQELQETYFQTVPLLSSLIELNDRHKKSHAKRVAKITKLIAKKMELPDKDIRQIFFGALLHQHFGQFSV